MSEVAVAGPWRLAFEKTLVSFGHKYPANKTMLSLCRRFGGKLLEREGNEFERLAVFETGGKMYCGGQKELGQLSLLYYFFGNITDVHTDDERGVVHLLRRAVKKGDIFFDVGANLGFYSFYVLPLCGRSGAVHAFEANPCLIPYLRRSVELNREYGIAKINDVAIGKESGGFLPLYGPERIGSSSLHPHQWLNQDSKVMVPVVTIDEYVRSQRIERIDVMKIDIEGAELDAFEGMEETFCTAAPSLIICELTLLPDQQDTHRHDAEISRRASSAADPRELTSFLKQRGYELWNIKPDGSLASGEALDLSGTSPLQLANVAFIRPEMKDRSPELFTK